MSNVIQFLESLGSKIALSAGEYIESIAELEVDGAQRQALISRDHTSLSHLLGGRAEMRCFVVAPNAE